MSYFWNHNLLLQVNERVCFWAAVSRCSDGFVRPWLSFGLPRSAAQKPFWQTESLQFQAAESRSSDRGSSSHLPCTCSRPRDRKQCWWTDADWWTAPDFDFSYSALHVGHLVGKLGLWSVGQLMVERVAQILLNGVFITDLDKAGWTVCVEWSWVGCTCEGCGLKRQALRCGLYLTLQLGRLFGMLGFQSFR